MSSPSALCWTRAARSSLKVFAAITFLVTTTCTISGNGDNNGVSDERLLPSDLRGQNEAKAAACFASDMAACDLLADRLAGEDEDAVRGYAETCGGRTGSDVGGCEATYPGALVGEGLAELPTDPGFVGGQAMACEAGDLAACDELAEITAAGAGLHEYALSCGGRVEPIEGCVEALLPTPLPTELVPDPGEASAVTGCQDGDLAACDSLRGSGDSDVATYGTRCGGRTRDVASCVGELDGVEIPPGLPLATGAISDSDADACRLGELPACDRLILEGDEGGSALYGATCAGRIDVVESCVEAFLAALAPPQLVPGLAEGAAEDLRARARQCLGSDWSSCDVLAQVASPELFPDAHMYGSTCGGRIDTPVASCGADARVAGVPAASEPPEDELEDELREIANDCYEGDFERCDELTQRAGPGYRQFREFGRTCGDIRDDPVPTCVESIPSPAPPSDGTDEPPSDVDDGEVTPRPTATPVGVGGVVVVESPAGVGDQVIPSTVAPVLHRPYDRILRRVFTTLQNEGYMELRFEPSGDLQVNRNTEVAILVKGPMPVRIPPELLDEIDASDSIELEVVGSRLNSAGEEATTVIRPSLMEVDLSGRPLLRRARMGRFLIQPTTEEPLSLTLIVSDLRVNGEHIELDYPMELGLFKVVPEPLATRLWRWLVLAGKLLAAPMVGLGIWAFKKGWERRHPILAPTQGGRPDQGQ